MTMVEQSGRAEFLQREVCIACGSRSLKTIASGLFGDEPLRSFLAADPWGTSPLPFIESERWNLVACVGCGQRFHGRILAPAWDERRFEEWMGPATREFELRRGAGFDSGFRKGQMNVAHVLRLEALTRGLRRGTPVRFLDFGCGWGQFPATAALFGFEAFGIDRDAHRRRDASAGFRVSARLEDLDGQFHAASMIEVLEHLVDPMSVLRALHSRLLPGAFLIVETPNCQGVRGIATMAEYRAVHPLDHLNAFTPTSLRRFVERAGFTVINPPPAHVTTDVARLARTLVKGVLAPLRPTTEIYCQRA